MLKHWILTARSLLLAGLLPLASCGGTDSTPPALSATFPPKPPQVTLVALNFDLHFARGGKIVSPGQSAGLANFVRTNAIAEGDTVTLESPGVASRVAAARRAAVGSELKHLQLHFVSTVNAQLSADSVRVHTDHAVVTAANCPDWSKPEADEPNNQPSSNYGCATEGNLAAMVANPADLVKPWESTAADGVVLAHGVELYRSGGLSKSLASSGSATGGSGGGASGGGGQ